MYYALIIVKRQHLDSIDKLNERVSQLLIRVCTRLNSIILLRQTKLMTLLSRSAFVINSLIPLW